MDTKTLVKSFATNVEGTYTLDGKAISFNDGYQVSFETTQELSTIEYNNTVNLLMKVLKSPAYIGYFAGTPEVSFYTKDRGLAMAIAKYYNQNSIYSWLEGECVENEFWDKVKNNCFGE